MPKRIAKYIKGDDLKDFGVEPKKAHDIIRLRKAVVAAYIVVICLAVFFLYLGYLTFIDTNIPVVYNNEPFPVVTQEVYPGELLIYEADFCRGDDSPVSFILGWRNIDTGGWQAGQGWTNVLGEPGCNVVYPQFVVPELPEGNYVLELSVTYNTNWFHKETKIIKTEQFFVRG